MTAIPKTRSALRQTSRRCLDFTASRRRRSSRNAPKGSIASTPVESMTDLERLVFMPRSFRALSERVAPTYRRTKNVHRIKNLQRDLRQNHGKGHVSYPPPKQMRVFEIGARRKAPCATPAFAADAGYRDCSQLRTSVVAVRAWRIINRDANGGPTGPTWRYAVHFRQPGPAPMPLSPDQLERYAHRRPADWRSEDLPQSR